ncbi:hypothetical protein L1049_000862 [Liquidambar formosana]|uniref:Cation-transporting P-type ATPase N-terminal domain-containing protein n=2 Tax=Liquidambar formosana TaxID=63359 RepID=A0AAP0NAH4_LIQFO
MTDIDRGAAIKAVPQDLHNQEEAGEEDEAEQAYSSLDPHEDRQHHQVQCEAQALAPHEARILSFIIMASNANISLEGIKNENIDLERIPVEEVFEQLKCTREGLTSEEGEQRLQIFGPNKLEEKKAIFFV